MPITPTVLDATAYSSDATSYSFPLSSQPGTDSLIIASYFHGAGGTVAAPTVSGCGLTWVEVLATDIAGLRRLSVWRAQGTVTSSGPVVFDHGSSSQTRAMALISEWFGTATSGTNGSGAIIQTVSTGAVSVSSSAPDVTLAGFSTTNNVAYFTIGSLGASTNATYTTTFTKLSEDASNAPVSNIMDAWQQGFSTPSATSTAAVLYNMIAMEIGVRSVSASFIRSPMLSLLGVS